MLMNGQEEVKQRPGFCVSGVSPQVTKVVGKQFFRW